VVPPTPTELGRVVVVVVTAEVVVVTTVVGGGPLLPRHPARAIEDRTAPTPSSDPRPIDHPKSWTYRSRCSEASASVFPKS
jgi:hypothetical protein